MTGNNTPDLAQQYEADRQAALQALGERQSGPTPQHAASMGASAVEGTLRPAGTPRRRSPTGRTAPQTREPDIAAGKLAALDLLGDSPDWQDRARCAKADPETFFPKEHDSPREAKQICARCEVKAECLEYALGHDEYFGIWGGLTERERRRLKRRAY